MIYISQDYELLLWELKNYQYMNYILEHINYIDPLKMEILLYLYIMEFVGNLSF